MGALGVGLPRTDSLLRSRAGRRRQTKLVPALPAAVLLLFVLAAIFAPLLTHYGPVKNNLLDNLQPPAFAQGGDSQHLLGTDGLGRDVLTRLLYGARVSFLVVAFSIAAAASIGLAVGTVSGYLGGRVDAVLMRIVDVMLALPSLLVALVVAVALGPSFRNLVLILSLLIWPNIARLVRSETMVLRNQDYVGYARAIGVPTRGVLFRHIFPNVLPTLLVASTLEVANVILTEASLSFLGAGVPSPEASWGVMIEDGRALIATGWWISLFPGIAIVIVVMAVNSLGEWLRNRFDPKMRRR